MSRVGNTTGDRIRAHRAAAQQAREVEAEQDLRETRAATVFGTIATLNEAATEMLLCLRLERDIVQAISSEEMYRATVEKIKLLATSLPE